MWRIGNPSALLAGMQTGAATVGNSMELPQRIKNETRSPFYTTQKNKFKTDQRLSV